MPPVGQQRQKGNKTHYVEQLYHNFRTVHQNSENRQLLHRVCLFVRMEHLGSHLRDFHEIRYFNIFPKSVDKIQVSLKYDKNDGYFT